MHRRFVETSVKLEAVLLRIACFAKTETVPAKWSEVSN
jgi:hypothetical protein